MKKWLVYLLVMFFCLSSCNETRHKTVASILQKWQGKKIQFPSNLIFTVQLKDTVKLSFDDGYKIVTYVDSIGCISCKLHLDRWKLFIADIDSLIPVPVQFLFFFSPDKQSDVYRALKVADFHYPVCLDEMDSLNKLNNFPSNMAYQTFLLDNENKVIAIGNPIHNFKVKKLYMNIIQGKTSTKEENAILTKVQVKENTLSLGRFNWQEEQKAQFMIYNVGKRPLVINDVTTSCGCISVDYSKQPVRPGDSISLQVTYKADYPEHFNKTITVYCNTTPSLIQLKITGNAE